MNPFNLATERAVFTPSLEVKTKALSLALILAQ